MGSTKYITSMGDLKRKDDSLCFRKGNKKWGVPHSGISHAYFRINNCLDIVSHDYSLMVH